MTVNQPDVSATFDTLVEILTPVEPTEEEIELQKEQLEQEQELKEQQQELMVQISEDISALATVLTDESQSAIIEETASTNEILLNLTTQVEELSLVVEEQGQYVEAGQSTLVTYGILYVPLLLIVIGGWWFFKQFLTDFR